ncbi:HAMP domain-containing histidine kinase [Methylobacterium sp. J-030]|uniref:sensor histidine kinase n=1 Tax=Methylobacterium sp. J-030 TaxID=2836627 RepID=UPI001FB973D0|nr:HAMP domain-containing sensor histidine kinase [Methylobacterium sp. J-030]MCJ2067348.1 HAMP domain-containing histidine kinase [Methylobacterium sp. J-030]
MPWTSTDQPAVGRPQLAALLLAPTLILGVFTADLIEPTDNVSICFAYTLPILLGVYLGPGSTFRLAAAATLASLVGSFIRPPEGGIAVSFVANRVIAVTAQWLVAFLVEQRRRNFAIVEAHLADERRAAETGRRFVQILTHEIATALTSIDGQGYRLTKLAPAIEPNEIVARAGKIRDAAARLQGLVARIRLAAEVGRGEIELHREALDARALLGPLAADHEGVRLILDIRQPEPALFGDRDLIYQAVANLVGNAVKYSPAPADIRITVAPSTVMAGTEIAVADQGSGIAPEELARVFEPYYRAGNSVGIPGIGVGLHLVRHFAEAHDGRVTLESRLGVGTTVRLHLPEPPP